MEMNIEATGIDATYFPVKDVQASIAFYRDTVGVEPSADSEELGAEYDFPEGAPRMSSLRSQTYGSSRTVPR